MSELSNTPLERSRKALSSVLQAMQEPAIGKTLAISMGTSESTISRIKSEKLEDVLALVYQLGFKVVPSDRVCVDKRTYESIAHIASRAMADESTAQKLVWGDE